VLSWKCSHLFAGPRRRPSPASGLVENRPALRRRRRPCGARRAVEAALPQQSAAWRPRRPGPGWPAGPAGSGRHQGPHLGSGSLTQDTGGPLKKATRPTQWVPGGSPALVGALGCSLRRTSVRLDPGEPGTPPRVPIRRMG